MILALMITVLGLKFGPQVAAARPQVSHLSQNPFPASKTFRCRVSCNATFVVPHTDNKDCSPLLNATRTNAPRTYTTIAKKREPGVPDDTMFFRFDDVPIHPDDLSIAMAAALYAACDRLSQHSGRESDEVNGGQFEISDLWYNFEVGLDLWSDQRLQFSHLRTIINVIFDLGRKFHMRQFTFQYHYVGRYLAVGHLKSAQIPPPPREHAQLGQTHEVAHGIVVYGGYGQSVDFERAVRALQVVFLSGWNTMTRTRKASNTIYYADPSFTYETQPPRLHFEVSVPETQLALEDILDIAFAVVIFGRFYYMQELSCIMTFGLPQRSKQIFGSFRIPSTLKMNGSIAGTNDTALQ